MKSDLNVELVRKLMFEHKLSQKKLGALLGLSQSAVGSYLTKRNTPPLPMLVKMASVFKVPVQSLINGENKRVILPNVPLEEYEELTKNVNSSSLGIVQFLFEDISSRIFNTDLIEDTKKTDVLKMVFKSFLLAFNKIQENAAATAPQNKKPGEQ